MGLSFGFASYRLRSWLTHSFDRSKLLAQADARIISRDEANNRLGISQHVRPEGLVIWLHAVDLKAAQDYGELIEQIVAWDPKASFVLTTEASDIATKGVLELPNVFHQIIVDDHTRFADHFLDQWKPDAAVWLSDSIYPLLLAQTQSRGIRCIYVNATITKSVRNKFRWFPNFMGAYLSRFARILASSDSSAIRLRRLNAPRKNLEVLGNFKAGAKALPCDEGQRTSFVSTIGTRPVWFAAHVTGTEVAILAKTQRRVSRTAQRLLLLLALAPGSTANSAKIRLEAMGLRVGLQSQVQFPREDIDVFIADEDSNLGLFYRVAPVSFIGGSLADRGGNDPFEAAALGSAILHGPFVENYQNSYDRLTDAGAARMAAKSDSLSQILSELLSPDKAAEMAHAAWEVSTAGAEANDRVFELLISYLSKTGGEDAPA